MINSKTLLFYKIDGVLQIMDETNKSQRYVTQIQHQDILALSNKQVINTFFFIISIKFHMFLI